MTLRPAEFEPSPVLSASAALDRAPAAEGAAASGAAKAVEAPLDCDQLLARCLGNLEFAQRLVGKFLQRFEGDCQQLEESVREGAQEPLVLLAHRLKGSTANLAAGELCRITGEIERLGRAGQFSHISGRLAELRRAGAELERYLSENPLAPAAGRPPAMSQGKPPCAS